MEQSKIIDTLETYQCSTAAIVANRNYVPIDFIVLDIDCMLLYILFWMFNGLIYTLLYYLGDEPMNRRSSPNCCFFLHISGFRRKGISNGVQTELNLRESYFFATNVIQRTWSGRQEITEEAMRQGARLPPGRASTLVGPSWLH